ncbi:hypothetical protein RF11_02059 [Thelohanellus kitauei]|uniref:Uncharacterized protein n=1 Tax=Thelohanellus kitauei TaxID=669202 RepID=A0A0C2MPZ3_THEKT|nr:hypothetical protein RF11_02059 [Thelohanellus kitauei]
MKQKGKLSENSSNESISEQCALMNESDILQDRKISQRRLCKIDIASLSKSEKSKSIDFNQHPLRPMINRSHTVAVRASSPRSTVQHPSSTDITDHELINSVDQSYNPCSKLFNQSGRNFRHSSIVIAGTGSPFDKYYHVYSEMELMMREIEENELSDYHNVLISSLRRHIMSRNRDNFLSWQKERIKQVLVKK